MSYYTTFELEIDDPEDSCPCDFMDLSDVILNTVTLEDKYAVKDIFDNEIVYRTWYKFDEDMIAISKAFPAMTFILTGHGEDYEDHWRHIYHGGECVHKYVAFFDWQEV